MKISKGNFSFILDRRNLKSMQEKYNWNLTDLFKNKEEFEKSIEK